MLRKTKIFLLIGSVILLITIVIVLITRSLSSTQGKLTEPIIPDETTRTPSVLIQSSSKVALNTKKNLLPKLPIIINGFQTSAGINTDITISSFPNDDADIVRIEIVGVDYTYNQNDPATNPNMVAFKESFQKVISVLKENNVDIKDLHVLLSNRLYIREIAETWLKTLNLLP